MLILGREIGQSVIIGDEVKVTVQQFGSKLKLAIDAPKHIRISRLKPHEGIKVKLQKQAKLVGDAFRIGESIKVTVLQTESGLLRFAIDAPKEVSIFREEIYKSRCLSNNKKVQAY